MPIETGATLAFNRGRISPLALARVDIDRVRWSAETQTNWMPRTLGSMMLRPGLGYIGTTRENAKARNLPFIFATDDTALIEVAASQLRVRINDVLVSRPSVSTAVTNGTFTTNLNDWTDSDESGATSSWATGGYMSLVGSGFNAAIRGQEVTVSGDDQNTEHGLRVVVNRDLVTVRVGSTSGDDDYVEEATLGVGEHSLSFTPSGNFHIQVKSSTQAATLIESITVESSGTMEIATPWAESALSLIRTTQSGDIIYIACEGYQQRKIERRGDGRSWSLVYYQPEDGPYRVENVGPITLTPSGQNGDITLTASQSLFRSGHAGALFAIDSVGQKVEATITAQDQFTDDIRVTGVDSSREFQITLSGLSGTGTTVTLQRSVDEPGTWVDVATYTTNQASVTYDDALDNQILFYRIGVKSGDYSSGTISADLTYSGGSITGVVRITSVTSSTSAEAAVLRQLGGTDASSIWREGVWSEFRGWPTTPEIYEGRLWWLGKAWWIGSVSDAYESFDPDTEGDAGPIVRTIGFGPVDTINWALALQRLVAGSEGAEISARSSSFDEPLTPTNFNLKDPTTQGSAKVAAVKFDSRAAFVQKSGTRVYSLEWDIQRGSSGDYAAVDLTALVPEIGEPSITHMAVQRQPDTRVHCIRSDGTAGVLVRDPAENVICWIDVTTPGASGEIEDVAVLPGSLEDRVYYIVKRTVNGATVRYHEKWALESECQGGTVNKQADSFVTFTNDPAASSIPAGTASHLVGESVVVWADGKCLRDNNNDIATFTVESDGGISALTNAGASYTATTGVLGLAYTAEYLSTKLAYASALGTALTQLKNQSGIGLIMANTHHRGLEFGPSSSNTNPLPSIKGGTTITEDTVYTAYDEPPIPWPGGWDSDTRVYLKARAPRPCTMLAAILPIRTNERV